MNQNRQNQTTDITDMVSVIRGRLWLILLCVCGVLAPIVYYNYTAPPEYEAKTSIIFEEGTQPIQTFFLSDGFARKSFITNQIEIITSRTLSESVVEALPSDIRTFMIAQLDIAGHTGWMDKIVNVLPLKRAMQSFPQVLDRKREIESLLTSAIRKNIEAEPVRDSDIINVTISAYSPEAAMVIANMVTDVLKKHSLEVKREEIKMTREYIEDQLTAFQNELEHTESALKEFKDVNRVTALQEEGRELLRRVTEVDVLYNQVKSERQGVEQRLSYLDQKLSESRETIVPDITQSSTPYIAQLQSSLVKLEVEKVGLLVQEYPEDHPQVQRLQQQIEEIKNTLRTAAAQIMANVAALIDPVSQMGIWVEELVSLRVQLAALQAQESTLKRAVDDYESGLQTLPEKELQLAQLTRAQKVNEQIYLMLHQRYEEARITEAGELGNIRVVDPAEQPLLPVRPRKRLNLILGIITGLTLGIGMAFLFESLDTALKTVEDIETHTDLPVFGWVPLRRGRVRVNKKADGPQLASDLIVFHKPKSPDAESYRILQTSLQFSRKDGALKSVLVTSPGPGEGKTCTVANLGISMAQAGMRTLLVDADLRRSMLHRLFDVEVEPGLTDVLKGEKTPEEVVRATGIDHLDLMTRGISVGTPSELLRSQEMKALLETLKGQYDMVLLDSPPVIAVTDAVVLSAAVDGVCVVAMSGLTHADALLHIKEPLDHAKARVLGVVLNKFDVRHSYKYYHYYYHHYYDYYEHEGKKGKRRV